MPLRRNPELRKMYFILAKLLVTSFALIPSEYFGRFIHIVHQPLETIRCLGFLILLIDVIAFRYVIMDEILARKGAFVRHSWSAPDAGLYALASVPLLMILIILFGAPILDSWVETLHLAGLLSVLVVVPFCLVFGRPPEEILRIFQTWDNENLADKACFFPCFLAAFGAWAGAVVIPLDWDRDWQKWPIPCCYGAFLGYAIGNLGWMMTISMRLLNRPSSHAMKPEKLTD